MIVVLGSSNTDMVVQVDQLPRPGETVLGDSFAMLAGGKGANQAVAASRAGAKVAFLGKVGDDTFGQQALKRLAADEIDISGVDRTADAPSGVALIFVSREGENSIAVAPGANSRITRDDVRRHAECIRNSDFLLLQLETPLEAVAEAVTLATANRVRVILNPAPAQPLPDGLLRSLDFITPNEGEAETLTGVAVKDAASAEKAAGILHARGVRNVIITLGPRGVFAATKEFTGMVEGFCVEPVDTTAAGDTFTGALAAALDEGHALPRALRFANAAAALSVTRPGAQASIPKRREIDSFLSEQGGAMGEETPRGKRGGEPS